MSNLPYIPADVFTKNLSHGLFIKHVNNIMNGGSENENEDLEELQQEIWEVL